MLNCFVCAKEHDETFNVCPFCRVRFCGDCKGETNLGRHKLLHRGIRRDMPVVTAEATEGMCAQVAEEEAVSIATQRMELVACGEEAVAAADVLDEYCAEVATEQAVNVAEERIEIMTLGYTPRCMKCGLLGKTYECEHCGGRYCSKECQKMDLQRHKFECEGHRILRAIPNYPEIKDLIDTLQKCMIQIVQSSLNMEKESHFDYIVHTALGTDSYFQNKELAKKAKKYERTKAQLTYDEIIEQIKAMGNAVKSNECNPLIKALSLKNRWEFFKELILFLWKKGENFDEMTLGMICEIASKILKTIKEITEKQGTDPPDTESDAVLQNYLKTIGYHEVMGEDDSPAARGPPRSELAKQEPRVAKKEPAEHDPPRSEVAKKEQGVAKKKLLCQFCQKKDPTKQCSICKQAFYCDKECQNKDWKKHKKTCKADAK